MQDEEEDLSEPANEDDDDFDEQDQSASPKQDEAQDSDDEAYYSRPQQPASQELAQVEVEEASPVAQDEVEAVGFEPELLQIQHSQDAYQRGQDSAGKQSQASGRSRASR